MHDVETLEKIMSKVHALLNKTMAAGCTEAEALAASELTAKLMFDYNISASKLAEKPSSMARETFDRSQEFNKVPADWCHEGISALCGVVMYNSVREERPLFGGPKKVRLLAIVGSKHDIEFAFWLYQMLDDMFEYEGKRYQKKNHKLPLKTIQDFQFAMANRVNERLLEMAAAQNGQSGDGKSLVILRNTALADALERMNIKLKTSNVLRNSDALAIAAGTLPGNQVILNRPLRQASRPHIGV